MTELDQRSSSGIYDVGVVHRQLEDDLGMVGVPALSDTDWDLLGSDLRIAPVDEIEADTVSRLRKLKEQDRIKATDVDIALIRQGDYVLHSYEQHLRTLESDYPSMAKSLQRIVIEELSRREQDRGHAYAQGSFESYQENIATIESVMTDLQADTDASVLDQSELDEALLANTYLHVWRKDVAAELTVKEIERLYSLAA